MDWSNERWIKLYPRITDEDLMLSWEARALWHEMLRRFDDSGIIKVRRGALGLAALCGMPGDVVTRVLPELVESGRIREVSNGTTGYIAPNYVAAQTARSSDRQRKQQERDRRRANALGNEPHISVTRGHSESQHVTANHSMSPSESLEESPQSAESERAVARVCLLTEDGQQIRGLSYSRSALNPDQFIVDKGDETLGIVEQVNGLWREVKR